MTAADRPRVSVVMPVHNGIRFLATALDGLRALPAHDEIVLVDDGSDDGSTEMLRGFADERPGTRVVRLPARQGPARARARGLDDANGVYVWFCDVDDEWDPSITRRLSDAAERTQADIVCARAEHQHWDGRVVAMEGSESEQVFGVADAAGAVLDGRIGGYLWNKLFRQTVLALPGPLELRTQEDMVVVVGAVAAARRIVLIPDLLYRYIDHGDKVTTAEELDNVDCAADLAVDRLAPLIIDARRRTVAVAYFRLWFRAVPSITTPVHEGWPRDEAANIRRKYRGDLTAGAVAEALRRLPRVALHAAAIRWAWPVFPTVYTAHRRLRSRRGRLTPPGRAC